MRPKFWTDLSLFGKIGLVFVLTLFAIVGIASLVDAIKKEPSPPPAIAAATPIAMAPAMPTPGPTPDTLEYAAGFLILKAIGPKQNATGKDKLQDFVVREYPEDDGAGGIRMVKQVHVKYLGDERFSGKGFVSEYESDAFEAMKAVFTSARCAEIHMVTMEPMGELLDQYGRKSIESVGQFTLYRKTAEKIAWENMYPDMLVPLLRQEGKYWLHPALLK